MALEARCRNCGNTGYDMFHRLCKCKIGRALEQMASAGLGNAPFVEPVSYGDAEAAQATDETLSIGDRVRVIGPAATSAGDTFAVGKETTVAELRTDDEGHTVYACQIRGWGFVAFPRASLERLGGTAAQPADEPRAIVRAFARAMERKLAANDATKGGWRDTGTFALLDLMRHEISEFQVAMYQFVNAEDRDVAEAELALLRQDVLDEAADVANYLMMLCDVCGALPPTDERGR